MRLLAAVLVAAAAGGAPVGTHSTSIGTVLTNKGGHTLYLRASDTSRKSTCYGACTKQWPPLLTAAKPLASSGVTAKLLGTLKRTDGKLQVTYAGHPLYLYSGDGAKGEVYGQGLQKVWWVVGTNGKAIKTMPPASTVPSYGGGGY